MANYTAIVSGGNTGIGAAIARGLLAEGYEVISLSRRKPDWSHPKLSSREVDLLDAAATRQAAAEIAAKAAITHVVHNAGAIRAGSTCATRATLALRLTIRQLHRQRTNMGQRIRPTE